ncbi:MAG: hypothetical protein M0R51_11510 [Clostridia bacterium]|jgi:hypothetical protein|nr:hypothetical protein [Clostridia bacterium]
MQKKCFVCSSKDFTYYNGGDLAICDACGIPVDTVEKNKANIIRWKEISLTPAEIKTLIFYKRGYKKKNLSNDKALIIDYVKRGLTLTDITKLINCPMYTLKEYLDEWSK